MAKQDKFKEAYEQEKAPTLRGILTNEDWKIKHEEVSFSEETGKYTFTATHKSGKVVTMSKSKRYVEQILKEVQDEIE